MCHPTPRLVFPDTTVLIIEHRLEDVLWRSVDRIVLVNGGTILADLRPDELLSGSLLAANALAPQCKVIGVEPEAGNDVQQSLRAGHIVKIATPRTIADGAQTLAPGDITFAIIQQRVSEVLTVTDEQLVEAMRFYAERMKIVVEPTGALSLAAAISGGLPLKGKRTGIVISGGNVDLERFASLLSE